MSKVNVGTEPGESVDGRRCESTTAATAHCAYCQAECNGTITDAKRNAYCSDYCKRLNAEMLLEGKPYTLNTDDCPPHKFVNGICVLCGCTFPVASEARDESKVSPQAAEGVGPDCYFCGRPLEELRRSDESEGEQ